MSIKWFIVENQNIYSNKKLIYSSVDTNTKSKPLPERRFSTAGIENTEKLLNVYQKQYNKITERLEKVKSKDYINDLKSKINNINQEIASIEKENRELHRNQIIQENLLSNNSSGKSPEKMESNLKKKVEQKDKILNDFIKTSKKIENDKEAIKSNEEKINILNEKYNNLTQMAKDMYNIEKFEAIDKIKKKSKEKKDKIARKKREFEVNIHAMKSNINKYPS